MAKKDEEVVPFGEGPETVSIGTMLPESWDDIYTALQSQGEDIVEWTSEWTLTDKKDLIGKEFIIANFDINTGGYGEFVSVRVLDKENNRMVFNDGSTGVKDQLKHLLNQTGRRSGVVCPRGLRVSNYTYVDPKDNAEKPAETYYIA